MARDSKPRKSKSEKFYTRAKSIKLLNEGADPTATFVNDKGSKLGRYTDHPNYHVKSLAFKKMGSPYPQDPSDCAKLCASLHIKLPQAPVEEELHVEVAAAIFPDEPAVQDEKSF